MDDMLLPLRRFADFQGRSRRREYWLFILFQWLIFLPLGLAFVVAGGDIAKLSNRPFDLQGGASQAVQIVGWLVVGFLVIPMLAVEVRRLHDQDRTGWWILLALVPFGQLPLFALMCFDGTAGGNRYGADPRRRDAIHRQDWRDAPADQAHMPPRPRLGDG
ncbi:DUF805 domain-containing protein [Sphingomonas sp. ZT3P38]|uniref:DUF805 domain-containing protein n=1 Tax=Parasphingomonas zepuensis TaxID=3096161 RepID=UPI002FCB4E90